MIRPPQSRRAARWARALGLAAAAAVALTACQGIPVSGPVSEGIADPERIDQEVIFDPAGPSEGASQEEIVRGFVNAASSSSDNFATAREYLTPAYADDWNPNPGVLIDDGSREAIPIGADVIGLNVRAVSAVTERGVMRLADPEATVQLRYELELVAGNWRIASAEPGLVLDRTTFATVYGQHDLFFVGPDGTSLTPDPRWFPTQATTSTNIVTELLAGPAEPLANGVLTTGFPQGTTLIGDSVPVTGKGAQIDLSLEALAADERARDLMQRQLSASLQSVAGLSEYQIKVDQSPFAAGDVSRDPRSRYPKVQSTSVVIREGDFGEYNGKTLRPIGPLGETIADAEPEAVTLAADGESAAMLADGTVALVDQSGSHPLDNRPGMIAPSIDGFGYVWSVPRGQPNALHATLYGSAQLDLPGTWVDAKEITALRLSSDGSRIAALVTVGEEPVAIIAGVIRDAGGAPTGITDPVPVAWLDGTAIDMDWIDEGRIAAVVQQSGGTNRVVIAGLRSFTLVSGIPTSVVSIAGANARSQLRVLDKSGALLAPQGNGWQRIADRVDILVKRG